MAFAGIFNILGPPPVLLVFVPPTIISLAIFTFRGEWHHKPLALIVGFQAYRILVEIGIHQATLEGVAPPQLSWDGMNFDVITGITALLLAPFATRLPKVVLHLWNLLGAGLLLNVVIVASLSVPTPFQVFKPDNIWIGHFPFCWLPLVIVPLAFFGHVVLFRHLRSISKP